MDQTVANEWEKMDLAAASAGQCPLCINIPQMLVYDHCRATIGCPQCGFTIALELLIDSQSLPPDVG